MAAGIPTHHQRSLNSSAVMRSHGKLQACCTWQLVKHMLASQKFSSFNLCVLRSVQILAVFQACVVATSSNLLQFWNVLEMSCLIFPKEPFTNSENQTSFFFLTLSVEYIFFMGKLKCWCTVVLFSSLYKGLVYTSLEVINLKTKCSHTI